MSGKELQAFAPGRSPAEIKQTLNRMLKSLDAGPVGTDGSLYMVEHERIGISTEARPQGTWFCVQWLGKFGTTQVDPAVADLFEDLQREMETEFGEDFVATTACHADEPYWPGGGGA